MAGKWRIYKCTKQGDNCRKFPPHWVMQSPDDDPDEGTIAFSWQAAINKVNYRIANPNSPLFYI